MEVAVSPELAKMLTMVKPVEPLASYDTCTHVGISKALVLPDGDSEHMTLFVATALVEDNDGKPKLLIIHGIASTHVKAVVRGKETIVPVRNGQKLTIKVIGDAPIECVPASDQAKSVNRLILKNQNDVTKVPVGGSIDFTYDEKAPGWRQV